MRILLFLLMILLTAVGANGCTTAESPETDAAVEPEPQPTAEPTPQPTAEPAPQPTAEPSQQPTAEPAPQPTAEPAPQPSAEPAPQPAAEPTPQPAPEPAPQPVGEPEPPPDMLCEYRALDFDAPEREYDVMGQSDERLDFDVPGVADAELTSARLTFRIYDADHPGQEGRIWVNGMGPYDIPTDGGGDNQYSDADLDVTGAVRPGGNRIEFGSSLVEARTFYRISRVALHVTGDIPECDAPPPPPPPEAVERSLGYRQARYTQRRHWVVRCNDYAFTARGNEHLDSDCDGEYRDGGPRTGTAIFAFPNLIEATYEVIIRSRHTENRNPRGALFIVDGEERRISQRSDRDRTNDVWGQKRMGGDVEVILDSTREDESDSIISVTLRPVGP